MFSGKKSWLLCRTHNSIRYCKQNQGFYRYFHPVRTGAFFSSVFGIHFASLLSHPLNIIRKLLQLPVPAHEGCNPLHTQVKHLQSLGLVQRQGPCYLYLTRHKAWVWRHGKQGINPQRFEARSVYRQLDQSTAQYIKDQSTYDSICMKHSKPNAWCSKEHSRQP